MTVQLARKHINFAQREVSAIQQTRDLYITLKVLRAEYESQDYGNTITEDFTVMPSLEHFTKEDLGAAMGIIFQITDLLDSPGVLTVLFKLLP